MKRQYLLDERDYRKYALLEDIAETGLFSRMALLWMLTPDDASGQGRTRTRDLSRQRLTTFFSQFDQRQPDFEDVAMYFRRLNLDVYSHELVYGTRSAAKYWSDVPDASLENALIFFDPDNGFEPAGGAKDAHLRWVDVADVWRRASGDSVVVAFQYGARKSHETLEAIRSTLADRLGTDTAAVGAGNVRFMLAGSTAVLSAIRDRLPGVAWVG